MATLIINQLLVLLYPLYWTEISLDICKSCKIFSSVKDIFVIIIIRISIISLLTTSHQHHHNHHPTYSSLRLNNKECIESVTKKNRIRLISFHYFHMASCKDVNTFSRMSFLRIIIFSSFFLLFGKVHFDVFSSFIREWKRVFVEYYIEWTEIALVQAEMNDNVGLFWGMRKMKLTDF